MSKTKQLQTLFEEWKKAQIEESDDNWTITKPKGTKNIKKQFFCEDGIIDESVYDTEKLKVLFITNEANIENHLEFIPANIGSRIDSFKDYYTSKKDPWDGKMCERICCLFQTIIDDYSKSPFIYARRFAFMNINKRGGDKDIGDGSHLAKYCELYSNYILKEIEIINPDIIIWLGTKSFNMDFKDKYLNAKKNDGKYYIEINNRMIPLIGTWHTSYYRISKSVIPLPAFNNRIIGKQATHLKEQLEWYNLL